MQMSVVDRPDGITHVTLVGSLDLKGTNEIDVKFQGAVAPRRQPTIVDMSGVSFISSLAMGMLVSAATSLRRNNRKMVLLNPNEDIAQAIRHARIEILLPIVDSLDQAVTAVLPAQA